MTLRYYIHNWNRTTPRIGVGQLFSDPEAKGAKASPAALRILPVSLQ